MRRLAVVTVLVLAWPGAAAAATGEYSTGTIDAPIPVERSLVVPDAGPVQHVTVSLRIVHPQDADLRISLTTPAGKTAVLSDRRGEGADFGSGRPGSQSATGLPVDAWYSSHVGSLPGVNDL